MIILKQKMDQNEVLRLCRVLVELNNDPHPGLLTWNMACQSVVEKLAHELVKNTIKG